MGPTRHTIKRHKVGVAHWRRCNASDSTTVDYRARKVASAHAQEQPIPTGLDLNRIFAAAKAHFGSDGVSEELSDPTPSDLWTLTESARIQLWQENPREYLRRMPRHIVQLLLGICVRMEERGKLDALDPQLVRAYKSLDL